MELTARATMMASSASIIHLVIRSRPFCRPMEQTAKPSATTNREYPTWVGAWERVALNASLISATPMPTNAPAAVLMK